MNMSPAFQFDHSTPGTLGLIGVLSFDTAAAALHAIQAELTRDAPTQLDLAGVTHSDSAGLACILAVVADADRRGHAVGLANMSAAMQALARVCEVDRLIA